MGICCCCGKEVENLQNNQLKNGEICNDCYNTILEKDNSISTDKLSNSTCAEINAIYNKKPKKIRLKDF